MQIMDGDYTAEVSWQTVTAGGFPVKPPADWFDDPGLASPTPITVTPEGRIYGHIATWRQSHVGMAGGVKPPKSKSNYQYFKTGQLTAADDSQLPVGQITLVGGHAPLDASVAETVKHYDDTESAIADVNVGEDRVGIWASGSVRPSAGDEQLRILQASSVSGDWRPVNGGLELMAVCSVNVPGFPVPRVRVASGVPVALVAAGIEPIVEAKLEELAVHEPVTSTDDSGDDMNAQFERIIQKLEELAGAETGEAVDVNDEDPPIPVKLEDHSVPSVPPAESSELFQITGELVELVSSLASKIDNLESVQASAVADVAADTPTDDVNERLERLERRETRRIQAALETGRIAREQERSVERERIELRKRVDPDVITWVDGQDIDYDIEDARVASLRARVAGNGMTATATSAWNAEKRAEAADMGWAMADGSYPVKDCRDVEKAVRAMGRGTKHSKSGIKRHIISRARSLNCLSHLPESWDVKGKSSS